ncbi:AAA family ATPase [Kitasatospora phosalacinea]|uniref:AAA family ATPase n=1 Tax=Kitasatospora phosalacinea TaxID=2065 RepID=UPI00052495D2|nr:AAA family ATPase [Kitasatospora phosalacinea]
MYVSRIRVSGVKCFTGAREVDLTIPPGPGWTVFAGPNGSGKSTLLRVLATALGALPSGPAARWGVDGWVQADPAPRWRVGDPQGAPRARYLPRAEGRRVPLDAELTAEVLPAGWRVSDPERQYVARGDLELPLDELGDGTAGLARLVSRLAADQATPGPVLLDDVDRHLHPRWQQRIGPWLTERFPHAQFLVTTHSPYVCQAADPGALIRLPGPDEERAPYRLDEELRQRVLYGSGEDTALSELFALPSAYSPAAEAERRLLVRLERKMYAGQASEAELAEYRVLGAKLNSSLTARVDEVTARLLGRDG